MTFNYSIILLEILNERLEINISTHLYYAEILAEQ